MKNDTINQLKVFKDKLDEFKGNDGILLTEAQKAQIEIMNSVSKSFDKVKLKGNLTSGISESTRKEIKLLAKDSKQETIPKILRLIQKLIDLECELTEDEKEFYSSFEGADFEKVKKDQGIILFKSDVALSIMEKLSK